MSKYLTRPIELTEISPIFKHIVHDFPVGEYAPYEILIQQVKNQKQAGWMFCRGEDSLAYAFVTNGPEYVLLSLLAVFPAYRGQGVGRAFLREIIKLYADRQALLGEVESPELAIDEAEKNQRIRRIRFYEDAGFYVVPGISYCIWDVPMDLVAYPARCSRERITENIVSIMQQIYLPLMGEKYMNKLQLTTKSP